MPSADRDVNHRPRSRGQAMIEFVIAILLVVILVTGILQFVELAGLKGQLLAEIRSDAGGHAMGQASVPTTAPAYIRDWREGRDALRHTADDLDERGSAADTLHVNVLDRATVRPDDWQYLADARSTETLRLRDSAMPASALGLFQTERREEVAVLPAMRDWLLGRDSVTVGAEIWFPRLRLEGFD